jgi:hypothetical protein
VTNSPPPLPVSPPKSRQPLSLPIKLCIIFGLFVVVVTIVLTVSTRLWARSTAAELAAVEAACREAGEPVTLEELAAWYPEVPEAENAAIVYLDAFSALETIDPRRMRISALVETIREFKHIEAYPPERRDLLKDFVAEAESVIALLLAAGERQESRFPIDLAEGVLVDVPHLWDLRESARVLYLSSEAALLAGDSELSVERHLGILHIGRALSAEPVLFSQMIRTGIDGMAFGALERLLNYAPLEPQQLGQLDAAYAAAYRPELFRRALLAERCGATAAIRQAYDGSQKTGLGILDQLNELNQQQPSGIRAYGDFEQLNVYAAFDSILPNSNPNWPAIASSGVDVGELPAISVLSRLLTSEIGESSEQFLRDAAQLRLARAAIAVERYRIDHGTLPEGLADCVPEYLEDVPQDPYDGAPLRYRRDASGYHLFSVSVNLEEDDGAQLENEKDAQDMLDLVFRVAR